MQRLLPSIDHCGNSERAHRLAVRLRDVNTPQGLRSITLRLSACTACIFFSGVSQISWSTPGVFLPLFSVTLRTARTLPLYEWVSRRCKACTLPHLLSFVACTIRTWSRRTLRLMVGQLMAYHSAASRETAPTACAVVICYCLMSRLVKFSRVKHHKGKSARFRVR